jgi:2-methylcitrate dehydratase PrpD
MPARNGVTAALLVKSGFSGNRDVLEGDQGIIKTYAPCDPAKLLAELGQRFTITSCLIKKYPVGSPMMETVDATLALLSKQTIRAGRYSSTSLSAYPKAARAR